MALTCWIHTLKHGVVAQIEEAEALHSAWRHSLRHPSGIMVPYTQKHVVWLL